MSGLQSTHGTKGYDCMPPDIVQATLPFLSPGDIRHLSHTNKYFHKLLNFDSSETLWHELYRKAFGTPYGNDEPFLNKNTGDFKTCSEAIVIQNYPTLSWQERYKIRAEKAMLYTWGCLKHSRLGFTAMSNPALSEENLNGIGGRIKFGVNTPTQVPWFSADYQQLDDKAIIQVSSGGFSFQLLTKSGKLFSTGSTFSGGHKGPGPIAGEHDYDPIRTAIRELENSFHSVQAGTAGQINTTGSFGATPSSFGPHRNLYEPLEQMEEKCAETVTGNQHVRRMFARNCFEIFTSSRVSFEVTQERLNSIKFIAVVSGRSHFLAMDEHRDLYSWDSPDSEFGVKLNFDGLSNRESNPIIKIGCGWDLNCAYIYKIGLVVWNNRRALKKEELSCTVNYKVIPNTADVIGAGKVVDFACFQGDCVIYITNNGEKLSRYYHGTVHDLDIPLEGKLSKLSSCFSSLVLFTDQFCYTLKVKDGEIESDSLTKLDLADPEEHIISVSSGDYHTMALTQKGNLYSWGLESQLCGCLGLGPPEKVIEQENLGTWEGLRNMRVPKPTKIKLKENYVCVAVCAGGWQTGALIIKK
ncbi:ZYBA0S03-05688g1_1 [Zygosaccharomyces bailii CLIB 213]|uniref:ZYBA0S03-05688g1_1 n=1 Tax=Zygosaccharomyces bailii (strain CLIB 213 / ATCC 58445 / CBS 680 / BCRC 21525 / NBRC 1098 / NCYC 1416 / NRRL Y-2227) TaxID=1333698 RepID=A0A8J2T4H9_ZYGB2|nr:ZYBA0S03-05688g1_1 [Zygosaccharomyces bailii CLIB 213]